MGQYTWFDHNHCSKSIEKVRQKIFHAFGWGVVGKIMFIFRKLTFYKGMTPFLYHKSYSHHRNPLLENYKWFFSSIQILIIFLCFWQSRKVCVKKVEGMACKAVANYQTLFIMNSINYWRHSNICSNYILGILFLMN
jgi:hypothetical protein